MSRGFYEFILKLVEKIESLLIKGTIALIILLITVQVALNDPINTDLQLKQLPLVKKTLTYLKLDKLKNYVKDFKATESKPANQANLAVIAEQQGIIELKILNSNNASQVKVLVNNQVRGTFKDDRFRLRVKNGDEIILDSKMINKGLWVKVTNLSDNIQNFQEGEQFWVKNNLKQLRRVELYKRY
ncbi:hypothetical protein [Selenihalanaerobacter shriftii]|uniref:Uncharacterized protein n=1 Tax=Selenihalanaerobacter shriftii TaxID=142842 RepID=A0A1T4LJK2_9FIRM|nr:hypothetical protein [Selenihalanaerobacter shriftii]SJZ54786.1 hypothetical protein SAMN02745118_01165 [Selenihalanaerobacter shriftii]